MAASTEGGAPDRERHPWAHAASFFTVATVVSSWVFRIPGYGALRIVAVCCGLVALVLMFWPIAILKRYGATRPAGSYMATTRVVDAGPYALVRHPQYLGYILLSATFALTSQHWLVILLAVAAMACFCAHAISEEGYMMATHGEAYRDYRTRVPRFNILLGTLRSLRR